MYTNIYSIHNSPGCGCNWARLRSTYLEVDVYAFHSRKAFKLIENPFSRSIETNIPLVRTDDPDEKLYSSAVETEERQHSFCVIYSIDHLSGASHAQPCGTDNKSIRLPYPTDDEEWGQTVPLVGF